MSRIGKLPINIPSGVEVTVAANKVQVKGKLGTLSQEVPAGISVVKENNQLLVKRENDEIQMRANHGRVRSILANQVKGVHEGFSRTLDIIGVGYRCEMKGKFLVLSLGYSHPIYFEFPQGVTGEVLEKGLRIMIKSHDKTLLGSVAAEIRGFRPPEPYKGKGIRYTDEKVKQKEGKAKG
ncbi:MAG: 50S ribosomal protein L6 [Deltaproteobacteria bacterium HGW-Deltaproteobacteria-17]|nr:MAG: 50S ribosomal protein L6 [Deltaproteobacteria bacterium HGW-Deltaproteobacteria-17]